MLCEHQGCIRMEAVVKCKSCKSNNLLCQDHFTTHLKTDHQDSLVALSLLEIEHLVKKWTKLELIKLRSQMIEETESIISLIVKITDIKIKKLNESNAGIKKIFRFKTIQFDSQKIKEIKVMIESLLHTDLNNTNEKTILLNQVEIQKKEILSLYKRIDDLIKEFKDLEIDSARIIENKNREIQQYLKVLEGNKESLKKKKLKLRRRENDLNKLKIENDKLKQTAEQKEKAYINLLEENEAMDKLVQELSKEREEFKHLIKSDALTQIPRNEIEYFDNKSKFLLDEKNKKRSNSFVGGDSSKKIIIKNEKKSSADWTNLNPIILTDLSYQTNKSSRTPTNYNTVMKTKINEQNYQSSRNLFKPK